MMDNSNITWGESMYSYGSLTTPSYEIETNKNKLMFEIDSVYALNNGSVEFNYSTSDDGLVWTEWEKSSENRTVVVDNINGEKFYIKFKAILYVDQWFNSPTFTSMTVKVRTAHSVENIGDIAFKPTLWITKRNNHGSIKLRNLKNQQVLEFSNLRKDETIFVDCENEDIMTSLPLTYRFEDHNDVFLEFPRGENFLQGEGEFDLDLKYKMKIY